MPSVNLAIISDLHCRLNTEPRDSFLTVGAPRLPSSRHPVQSLLELIGSAGLAADALLLPGDFANRASLEGLSQGWDYCAEVGRALNAHVVVPVIGNHDIDSHRVRPDEPVMSAVQNLRPDFPFRDPADNRRFFADGYAVISTGDLDVIAINTVIDHTDAASAKRGTFSLARIEKMERELHGALRAPIRIALMHHHPMVHSGTFLRDEDVLATGDRLMAALRRLGCRLIVHGHKHFARLAFVDGLAVLASGSFSAHLYEYGTSMGNTFHMVRLQDARATDIKGEIRTWAFGLGQGWIKAHEERYGFPHITGFGRTDSLPAIATALIALGASEPTHDRFSEATVIAAAPDVPFLTPLERRDLNQTLRDSGFTLAEYAQGKLELWREFNP